MTLKKKLTGGLRRYFPSIFLILKGIKLLYSRESYLVQTGFIRSILEDAPIDGMGNCTPWINYNAISFLKSRLSKNMHIFEYGCGFSTRFYSSLVSTVTAVESDREWYQRVQNGLPSNVLLRFQAIEESDLYSGVILNEDKLFNVVIVDGMNRNNCVKNSIRMLADDGVIILDDSQREEFAEGISYLLQSGFRRVDFEGLKPAGFSLDRTTVFYRSNNCLGI